MTTKHTKGPWEVYIQGNMRRKTYKVAQFTRGNYPQDLARLDKEDIATVSGPNAEANARLIASAPELLKTLEDDHHHYLSLDFENNENTPKLWHGLSEVLKWHLTEHPDCTTCKIINKAKGEL